MNETHEELDQTTEHPNDICEKGMAQLERNISTLFHGLEYDGSFGELVASQK